MLPLLRTVGLRYYREAPGRLALITVGIASGVALVAALGIINRTVLVNFRVMLERAAGKAALQVVLGTGEVGFDERVAEVVREDPDVAAAFPLVRGTIARADGSGDALQLFGIDLVSEAVESYDVRVVGRDADALELLRDPTAVFLTEEYAARRGLVVGDRVAFGTPTGIRSLHVRGLLRAEGMASLFGGSLAVMDSFAAQRLLGKEGRADQIDVVLREGARVAIVKTRLGKSLPLSLTVVESALRGARFERAIEAFQSVLDSQSLLCLLAGIFIVYNASATAVTQRARDLAIVLAVGGERRRLFALVLGEMAVIGTGASLLGVALGLGLARVLLGFVAQSMGAIFQTRFSLGGLELGVGQVGLYVLIGTAGSVMAALVPARKASRLDPLELMRPDFRERLAISSPTRLLLGVVVALVGATAVAVYLEDTQRSIFWGNVAACLAWLATVILAIPVMTATTAGLRRVLPRLFGFEGRVAAESLGRSPGRTGVTAAVIALSLALATTVESVAVSFRESERNWFILVGDLIVSAVSTEGGWLETPVGADVGERLGALPGVARVETYRVLAGQPYGDARIAVVGVSPGFVDSALFRGQIRAGDPEAAVRAIAAGDGIVVSDSLADRFGLAPGDRVELATPRGLRAFPVVAAVGADYSGDQGSVIVARDVFVALWGDARVSHFNIFLEPGVDPGRVQDLLAGSVGRDHLLKVLTVPQALAYHQGMVDRALAFTYAVQLLMVTVTLAGIFDLLATQMIERRREIGVLRALGADRASVARAIRLEAAVIGVVGAVEGAVLGMGTSFLWVRFNFRILIGYVLEHQPALGTAIWCVALAGGFAVIAGQLAARSTLRAPVLDALRYE